MQREGKMAAEITQHTVCGMVTKKTTVCLSKESFDKKFVS